MSDLSEFLNSEGQEESVILSALEMARCVDVNLDNMGAMTPMLNMHPMFKVVKLQILECIELLEKVTGNRR